MKNSCADNDNVNKKKIGEYRYSKNLVALGVETAILNLLGAKTQDPKIKEIKLIKETSGFSNNFKDSTSIKQPVVNTILLEENIENDRDFICFEVYFGDSNSTPLVHVKEKTVNPNCISSHNCRFCDYSTTKLEEFRNHVTEEHIENIHKCRYCDLVSFSVQQQYDHNKKCHPIVDVNFPEFEAGVCDYCTVADVDVGENHLKCTLCDYTTSQPDSLRKHVVLLHFV